MADKEDNITKGSFNDFQGALHMLQHNKQEYLEYVVLVAEITKAKYDALIKQGFTEKQALELSKTIF